MTIRSQNLIFTAFAVGFLITAPTVILSTAGYRYNQFSHRLEKTGILTVETTPRGATIFLDNTLHNNRTPTIIQRLLPQEYQLRLEKEGYLSWKKPLDIKSGKSTLATNIVLLKDNPFILWNGEPNTPKPVPSLEGFTTLRWGKDDNILWGIRHEGIFRVDTANNLTPIMVTAGTFDDVIDDGNGLLRLEHRGTTLALVRSSYSGTNTTTLANFSRYNSLRFIAAQAPYVAINDPTTGRGEVVNTSHSPTQQQISLDIRRIQWGEKKFEDLLLVCSDFEVSILDLNTFKTQNITRLGEPLLDCAWHPSGAYAIIATTSTVTAIDIDPREPRQRYVLAEGVISEMHVDSNNSLLWVTGTLFTTEMAHYKREL